LKLEASHSSFSIIGCMSLEHPRDICNSKMILALK